MGLLTRKRVLLAEIESSYGVDPTPTGAANAMLVRNLQITPFVGEMVSRDHVSASLGPVDLITAQKYVQCEFEIELAGSGAAGTAPAWGSLMKACGMGETVVASTSVTYDPVSTAFSSVTLYYNIDGLLHKITGARGSFEISLNVKQIPVIKFSFTGIYNNPSDTALPTADYSSFQTPKIANTTNTTTCELLSYAGKVEGLSLSIGNDVQYRELINLEQVDIVSRAPSGSVTLEAPTIAAKDFFSAAKNNTTGTLSVVHGTAAGNIVTISAPRVFTGAPSYQDSQGVQMLSIPLTFAKDSGNDELAIALT
jgi:hypothetical protein